MDEQAGEAQRQAIGEFVGAAMGVEQSLTEYAALLARGGMSGESIRHHLIELVGKLDVEWIVKHAREKVSTA